MGSLGSVCQAQVVLTHFECRHSLIIVFQELSLLVHSKDPSNPKFNFQQPDVSGQLSFKGYLSQISKHRRAIQLFHQLPFTDMSFMSFVNPFRNMSRLLTVATSLDSEFHFLIVGCAKTYSVNQLRWMILNSSILNRPRKIRFPSRLWLPSVLFGIPLHFTFTDHLIHFDFLPRFPLLFWSKLGLFMQAGLD